MGNDKTAVRPFSANVPEAELDDLRSRVNAAKWPGRETVTDDSQGVPLAMMQELARYWAAVHDRDRWVRHSLHSRPLGSRKRIAAHRHARVARIGHRAAEDHRPAHQPHGTWRERIGCFPSCDPVNAGLRVLRQADRYRLGPRPHRPRLGSADGAPGI